MTKLNLQTYIRRCGRYGTCTCGSRPDAATWWRRWHQIVPNPVLLCRRSGAASSCPCHLPSSQRLTLKIKALRVRNAARRWAVNAVWHAQSKSKRRFGTVSLVPVGVLLYHSWVNACCVKTQHSLCHPESEWYRATPGAGPPALTLKLLHQLWFSHFTLENKATPFTRTSYNRTTAIRNDIMIIIIVTMIITVVRTGMLRHVKHAVVQPRVKALN